jgi:hypothetical protein
LNLQLQIPDVLVDFILHEKEVAGPKQRESGALEKWKTARVRAQSPSLDAAHGLGHISSENMPTNMIYV